MAMCDHNNNHKRNEERTIYLIVQTPKPWMKIIALALIVILFILGVPKGAPIDVNHVHQGVDVLLHAYVPYEPLRNWIAPIVQKGVDVVIVMFGNARTHFFTVLAEPQTISLPSK